MALQYFTGFEDGTLTAVSELTAGYTNVTTTPRTGARCLNFTSSDAAGIGFPTNLSATADACIVGFGVNFPSVAGGTGAFAAIQFGSAGSYIALQLNNGNFDALRTSNYTVSGTVLGSSSGTPLQANVWHYMEMRVIFSDTVGVVEVHVDGNQVINLTSQDTIQTGSGETARTVILRGEVTNTLFDDLYLLDPTGESAPYNTFLGPIGVERIVPDGDSLTTSWTSSGANFWSVLDEVPVVNTDYADSNTASSDLRMTMTNRAEGGSILGVKPHCIAEIQTGSGPRNVAAFVRSDPGGTPTDSTKTGQAVPIGETEIYSIVLDDPDTAADWTDGGINGAEIGVEITS